LDFENASNHCCAFTTLTNIISRKKLLRYEPFRNFFKLRVPEWQCQGAYAQHSPSAAAAACAQSVVGPVYFFRLIFIDIVFTPFHASTLMLHLHPFSKKGKQ
jgi:hypothetical protein